MCLSTPYSLVSYLYSKVWAQRHGKNAKNLPYLQQQTRSTSCSRKSVPRAKHAAALPSTFQMEEVCKVISPARRSLRSAICPCSQRGQAPRAPRDDPAPTWGQRIPQARRSPTAGGGTPDPCPNDPRGQLTSLSLPELGKLILCEERGLGISTKSPRH